MDDTINIDPEGALDCLPAAGASIEAIGEFALTFNGYAYWDAAAPGRRNACGQRANETSRQFAESGVLPDALVDLRTALFFKQRAAHHHGFMDACSEEFCRALVEKIREVAGLIDVDSGG